MEGDIAWVAADARAVMVVQAKEETFKGILTAVLKKTDGSWKFIQAHFSEPLKKGATTDQGTTIQPLQP